MDFPLISARIDSLSYSRVDEFVRDVRLVFTNCIAYWGPRMMYSIRARYLLDEVDLKVKEMKFALATGVQAESGVGKKGGKGAGHSKGGSALAALKPWAAPALQHLVAVGSVVKGEGSRADTPATPSTPGTPMAFPSSSASGGGGAGVESFERAVMSPAEYAKCNAIISQLKASPAYALFLLPPDIPGIPLFEYYARIPRCMDLTTLSRRLKVLDFATSDEFIADVSLIWRNVAAYYDDTGEAANFGEEAEDIRRLARQLEADFTRRWDTFDANKGAGRGTGHTVATAAAPSASPDKSPPPSPSPAPLSVSSARSSPSSSTLIVLKRAPGAVQLPADAKPQPSRDTAEGSGAQAPVKKEEPSAQPHLKTESASSGLHDGHSDTRRSTSPAPLASAPSASALPGEGASDAVKVEVEGTAGKRFPKKVKVKDEAPSSHAPMSDVSTVSSAPAQPRTRGPSPLPPSISSTTAASTAASQKLTAAAHPARGGGAQTTSAPLPRPDSAAGAAASSSSSSSLLPQIWPAPPKAHKGKMVLKPLTPAQRMELLQEPIAKLSAQRHLPSKRKRSSAPHPTTQATRQPSLHHHTSAPLSPLLPPSLMPKGLTPLSLPSPALHPSSIPSAIALLPSKPPCRSTGVQLPVSLPCGPSSTAYARCGFVQAAASSAWLRGSHSLVRATSFFPYHVDVFTIDLAWGEGDRAQSVAPFSLLCSSSDRVGEYVDELMPATAAALEEAASRFLGCKRSRLEMEAEKGGKKLELSLGALQRIAVGDAGDASASSPAWPRLFCRPVRQADVAHLHRLPDRLLELQHVVEERETDDDGQRSLAEPSGPEWEDGEAQRSTLRHYAALTSDSSEEDDTSTSTRWEQPGLWWTSHLRWDKDTATPPHHSNQGDKHLLPSVEMTVESRQTGVDGLSTLSASSSSLSRRCRFRLRPSDSLLEGAPRSLERVLVPFIRVRLFGFAGLWKVGLQWRSTVDAVAPSLLHAQQLWTASTVAVYQQQQLREAEREQQRRTEENERRLREEYGDGDDHALLHSILHTPTLLPTLTPAAQAAGSTHMMDES